MKKHKRFVAGMMALIMAVMVMAVTVEAADHIIVEAAPVTMAPLSGGGDPPEFPWD